MKRILLLGAATFALATPAHAQHEHDEGPEPTPAVDAAMEKDEDGEDKWDVSTPRGPGENVAIDTTSGTWMSLDVSPNGQEIVFDLLGDIYLLPMGGGDAVPIATGHQWDMQPVFTPDGSQIAFTSDRSGGDNLWVMNRDGSDPVQVSDESFRLLNQPEWTPDGEYVVGRKHFTSARSLGAGEMWMYHKSGGSGGVQMTKRRTDQKDTGEPAFSPDGRYMYFSDDATPGDTFEYSKDVNGQIYVIRRLDRETGEIETIVSGAGGAIRPTPSSDGKSLAFIRRVRAKSVIMVMDLESGRITPVTDILDRDMQETWAVHGVYPHMAWTPDNRDIVFWADGGIKRVNVASRAVSDIPFRVTGSRFVADAVRFQQDAAPDSFQTRALRFVTVRPGGNSVVFEALGKLHVRDMATGSTRALTGDTDRMQSYPTFSRDGSQLAWVEWDDQDLARIMVARGDGSRARALDLPPGHYVEPAFSPDGTHLAYRRTGGGFITSPLYSRDTGLYVKRLSGGEPMRVSRGGSDPQWGRDSSRLFFITGEDDATVLKSVDLETRDMRTHFSSEFAGDYKISPDENWVAFTERFQTYILPFARSGRTQTLNPKDKSLPQAQVTTDVGDWVHWASDSDTLYFAEGPTLYRRSVVDPASLGDGETERLADLAVTATMAKPSGMLALTGARIITMNGDEVIENGTILIDGDTISAVGPTAAMTYPAGTPTVDVTGKTIIPGLIDAHWHGPMGAGLVIPQQNWSHAASLAYGVTTVQDPSNNSYTVFAASEYQKAGRILAPRIFSTGTILYGATTPFTAQIDSLDDARSHLRRLKAMGAWSVKSYNQPRRDQRQMVIQAARELEMEVMPEGGSLFMHNMTMVADGHTTIEHAIPVANIYDDVTDFWGGKSDDDVTAYTPTLNVAYGGPWGEMYWYMTTPVWAEPILQRWVPRGNLDAASRRGTFFPIEENNLKSVAASAKKLNDVGVLTNIGAHGQREGLGAHWEIWAFELGGMDPIAAIRSATLNPATTLGLDHQLGSITAGKLADLVVLDGNPLEDIKATRTVNMVMLGGRLMDQNLTTIAGGSGQLEPFWFQTTAGDDYSGGATESVPHED